MNALLSATPIIVESARLSPPNIKQQACPSINLNFLNWSVNHFKIAHFKVKLTTKFAN